MREGEGEREREAGGQGTRAEDEGGVGVRIKTVSHRQLLTTRYDLRADEDEV